MKHLHIVGDVEASGQCPGLYDMISIGLIVVEPSLDRTFYAEMAPLHDDFDTGAYEACGVTRQQHKAMPKPESAMQAMFEWIASLEADRLTFISDNNGFDWQFLNWYTHWMLGLHTRQRPFQDVRYKARQTLGFEPGTIRSPWGHSSRRIGDLAAGLAGNIKATTGWKKHRMTKHTHRADDDARGNAEALLHLIGKYDLEKLW